MPDQRSYLYNAPKVLLYCIAGSVALTFVTCTSCRVDGPKYLLVSGFSLIVWFVLWMGNGMIAHYLEGRISWVEAPIRRLVMGIVTTVVFSTSVVVILLLSWEYIFHFPLGNYYVIVGYSLLMTFAICLILYSAAFLKSWKESAIHAEKLQQENIRAQYDSLRSQVNPHFLFNSLNALTNLVYEDQDRAAKFIKQLSEVYRYVLDTRMMELVSLETELRFLRSYVYLQEIRFDNNLKVEIGAMNESHRVAPLALQLLMENAIKHNIISKDHPLAVKVYEQDGYLVVENNLQKKTAPEEESGMGLENIQKRYSFLTDQKVSVEEGAGKFIVRLPILRL